MNTSKDLSWSRGSSAKKVLVHGWEYSQTRVLSLWQEIMVTTQRLTVMTATRAERVKIKAFGGKIWHRSGNSALARLLTWKMEC